jgi:hypothetical protein
MSAIPKPSSKIVQLPARPTAAQQRATQTATEVRRHLSLLQGYADLMEGLSPDQSVQILQVMAEKIGELTRTLRPFLQQDVTVRDLNDYRETRTQTRRLLDEYRFLLDRIHDRVTEAQANLPTPVR